MRSVFIAVLILLSISSVAADDQSFSLGGGLTFSDIETDESLGSSVDEEIGVGLNLGARGLFSLSEGLKFRTGLYFQEKAAKFSIKAPGIEGDLTARIISAAIPLNLQFQVSPMLSLFGGYSADFTINEYCTSSGDLSSCSIGEDAKSIVHNAVVGVSIFGNDKLDVDVSYQHGLTEVLDDLKLHTFLIQGFVKL